MQQLDPYIYSQNEILRNIASAKRDYSDWRDSVNRSEDKSAFERLQQTIRSIEWDIEDIQDSISASEKNSVKFNLGEDDIKARRQFIESVKSLVRSCKRQMANPSLLQPNSNIISFAIDVPKSKSQISESRYSDAPITLRSPEYTHSTKDLLLKDQQNIINEQNVQLDLLGSSITRLKDMSSNIGQELDDQVNLLGEFNDELVHTESRMDASIKRIEQFLHLSTEKRQWSVIIGLTITLLIILLLLVMT